MPDWLAAIAVTGTTYTGVHFLGWWGLALTPAAILFFGACAATMEGR